MEAQRPDPPRIGIIVMTQPFLLNNGVISMPMHKGDGSIVKLRFDDGVWFISSADEGLACLLPNIAPGKGIRSIRIVSRGGPARHFVFAEAMDVSDETPICPDCFNNGSDCEKWSHWFGMSQAARDLLRAYEPEVFQNGFPNRVPLGAAYWEDLAANGGEPKPVVAAEIPVAVRKDTFFSLAQPNRGSETGTQSFHGKPRRKWRPTYRVRRIKRFK